MSKVKRKTTKIHAVSLDPEMDKDEIIELRKSRSALLVKFRDRLFKLLPIEGVRPRGMDFENYPFILKTQESTKKSQYFYEVLGILEQPDRQLRKKSKKIRRT